MIVRHKKEFKVGSFYYVSWSKGPREYLGEYREHYEATMSPYYIFDFMAYNGHEPSRLDDEFKLLVHFEAEDPDGYTTREVPWVELPLYLGFDRIWPRLGDHIKGTL